MRTSTTANRLQRLLNAGGFALIAAAAPALLGATAAAPVSDPAATCPPGEHADVFSGQCVPHLVPRSSPGPTAIPGNPDVPAVSGIPCTPENIGQCIGLTESERR
ncbi:intersectin-EH binding protein Ibp1 [Mycolicibacterium thermoresistibile]